MSSWERVDMLRRQPPLTGGRNATSSPERRGVSQAANSWLREATTDERYFASSGCCAVYRAKSCSIVAASEKSAESSACPVTSLRRPKKRTVTRIVCEAGGTRGL